MKTAVCKNISTGWNQKVDDAWNFTLMPTNPRIVHELITLWSLNTKTPHHPLQGGSHSLEGIIPLRRPLPDRAIKSYSFLLHPKLCLHISVQHLVNRGWVLATPLKFENLCLLFSSITVSAIAQATWYCGQTWSHGCWVLALPLSKYCGLGAVTSLLNLIFKMQVTLCINQHNTENQN